MLCPRQQLLTGSSRQILKTHNIINKGEKNQLLNVILADTYSNYVEFVRHFQP